VSFLRSLTFILSIVATVLEFFKSRRQRQEAKQVAEADIIVQNEERHRKAAEVIAEHRVPDDTVGRLRDGKF
jgi:hypothetical protein